MTFVIRRFQPADLLLGGPQFAGKLDLRKAGLLAESDKFRATSHASPALEALGKNRVSQLFFQKRKGCSFSYYLSMPVTHPLAGGVEIARWDGLTFLRTP